MHSFRAPGRVNLIGDHTDYNDGLVLPVAIDLECVVHATPRADDVVEVDWLDGDAGSDRYVDALRAVLGEQGRADVGMDARVSSTIPVGSGLSSSAALEVALALALCDVAGLELSPTELALACRRAEQLATGVPCGIMDQLTSVAGRAGCALLIDCRSLEVEPIKLPDERRHRRRPLRPAPRARAQRVRGAPRSVRSRRDPAWSDSAARRVPRAGGRRAPGAARRLRERTRARVGRRSTARRPR